jgi:hypothetical protein
VLFALSVNNPVAVLKDSETIGWVQPAEWLELAASIGKVDVNTWQYDAYPFMCGLAAEYEDRRSEALTKFVTSLTIFSYVWGAFESVAKILSPSSIPKKLRKNGDDSLTARVAHALRSVEPDGVYRCALANIRCRLACHPEYSSRFPSNFQPVTEAAAGEDIELVRIIRNRFAHGTISLPQPDDSDGQDSLDDQLVRFSCRIVVGYSRRDHNHSRIRWSPCSLTDLAAGI